MDEKLLDLIRKSERILITSHISPDPDALSSTILLNETLRLNFPDKKVIAVLEEEPQDLNFIPGFDGLQFGSVYGELKKQKSDLFILLDANNYDRCSRHDGDKIQQYLIKNGVKTAIIDHHEEAGKEDTDVFINNDSYATVQDVYRLLFKHLGLKKPEQAAQTAMTGFYADTGGFVYLKAAKQKDLFGFAEELVTAGAEVEAIKNRLESYSQDDLKVIGEFAKNLEHSGDYSYSFLSDEFIAGWVQAGRQHLGLQRPTNAFLNNYIRNIEGRSWGFIVYKNLAQGENIYSASFRSQAGQPDVAAIAMSLGGGGHKPAAGAKFEAKSVEDALEKVQAAIRGSR